MSVATLAEVEERHSREAIEAEIVRFEERIQQLQSGAITPGTVPAVPLEARHIWAAAAGISDVAGEDCSGSAEASQLRVLAEIADEYSTGRGHLTTRENVQFHFVKLENVGAAMRLLADAGLTTREACGNTVRNVTACPVAGICPGEAFDVTPYAWASHDIFCGIRFSRLAAQVQDRFSPAARTMAHARLRGIHDIGLIAQVRGSNGTAHRGFKVLVGGGLGSLPTEAAVLTTFCRKGICSRR